MNRTVVMKDRRLIEALDYIDDEYIASAALYKMRAYAESARPPAQTAGQSIKKYWKQLAALAACLLVLSLATPLFSRLPEIISSFAAGWVEGSNPVLETTASPLVTSDIVHDTTEITDVDSFETSNPDTESVAFDQNYLLFIPELEEIDDETILKVKKAWSQYRYDIIYSSEYPLYVYRGYSDEEAQKIASENATRDAESSYKQFFNSEYFYYYGYLGTINNSVVLASYSGAGQPLNGYTVGGVDFGFRARIYVYTDEKIISLEEAYENDLFSSEELILIKERNEQYIESAYDYYVKQFEQYQNGKE